MTTLYRSACALLAAAVAAPSAAQITQDAMQVRYDRSLAAGYKALMLCGAIANAERAGAERSIESVENWELRGIQAPMDALLAELPATVVREPASPGQEPEIVYVSVDWASDMPARLALHDAGRGCGLQPVGAVVPPARIAYEGMAPAPLTLQPFRSGSLGAVAGGAFAGEYGENARTTAVLVMHKGRLVGERYAAGFGPAVPQRTWSVAKSIAATMVGLAVHRGEIRTGQSAGIGVGVSDPRRAITIDHLLRMASGRYSDTPGNRTDALYFGGGTVEETAAHWPMLYKPGTVFRYANNDTLMAVKAIGPSLAKHPPAELFATLGMTRTVAETDWRGDYILSSQVWSTARDLAALGQLYASNGVWQGRRLLPESWLAYVSTPSGPQPAGELGYGAGFWLFNKSTGIPADTIAMQGNRGQYVVIVPSRQIVIVRRGEDPAGASFDAIGFTRDMLVALRD